MTIKRLFLLVEVLNALDECLPGCRWTIGRHNYRIYPPDGGASCRFPTGAHGKKSGRAEIQRQHVQNLAEVFGVKECLEKALPGL